MKKTPPFNLRIELNEDLEILSVEGPSNSQYNVSIPKDLPAGIKNLEPTLRFLIMESIGHMELNNLERYQINSQSIQPQGLPPGNMHFRLISNKSEKRYEVLISSETVQDSPFPASRSKAVKSSTTKDLKTGFSSFFSRLEKIGDEFDKRNKITNELIALNKELILKDQVIRKSSSNLEALINNNLQGFILVDTFYSIQIFNRKADHIISQFSNTKLEKNKFYLEFFTGTDLTAIKEDFQRIRRGFERHFSVTRNYIHHETGKIFTLQINYTAVRDNEGNLDSVSIGFLDITDIKNTELEARLLKEENEQILNQSPDIICTINPQGEFEKVSAASLVLLGYMPEEMIGKPYTDFIKKEDIPKSKEMYKNLLKGIPTNNFENFYTHKNGSFIPMIWSARWDKQNELIFAIGRDGTEKKKNKEILEKRNEVYELINRSSTDAIYELSFPDHHMTWITSLNNILKKQGDEIQIDSLSKKFELIHAEEKPDVLNHWEDFLASGGTDWQCSFRMLQGDMGYLHIKEMGFLLRDKYGKPLRMTGLLKDITEEKKLEFSLKRSAKLARIGSWEIDLINKQVFWSAMIKTIFGKPQDFEPDYQEVMHLFISDVNTLDKIDTVSSESIQAIDKEILINIGANIKRWIRVTGDYEILNGRPIKVFGSLQDIDEQKKASLELIDKTKFLSKLTEINRILMDRTEWEKTISDVFEAVGELLDLKRIYFASNYSDKQNNTFRCQYEWSNIIPEKDPKPSSLLYFEKNSVIINKLKNGELVIPSYSDFQGELRQEQETLINASIFCPIVLKGKFYGFLGFEDFKQEREWSRQESDFINTVTQHLTIAYESYLTELRIREVHQERETILNSIQDGFFSMTNKWRINYWNDKAEELTGISREKALGRSLWRIFPKITDLPIKGEIIEAITQNQKKVVESLFPGMKKWFELTIYPSGNKGTTVYFKDISDKKIKERELMISNQRFEKVAEATSDAIWDWDILNDSLYRGPGFDKIFGFNFKKELTQKEFWTDSFYPDDLEHLKSSVEEAIKDKTCSHWQAEYRVIRKDGEIRNVADKGIILRNETGKAFRMIGAVTDITDRKEYERSLEYLNKILQNRAEELTQANIELERFAYIASHDLQEPLRMITGFLTQLEKKYANQLDEKAHQYIHYAVDGAERMRKIILDLLEYSKLGKIESHKLTTVDLNEVLEEVLDILNDRVQEAGARIEYDHLPSLSGVKLSFVQIFQNLIGNALKYRKEEGNPRITISVESKERNFIFSIKDNGIGIDPRFYERIFVIFQRLHNKDSYSGTGVGLAIVKKIIEQMNGKIWVEGNDQGGATFYFSLPKN
ncbi:MAG: PAS domain S-box protein [Brumimicrobium sp.]|nr:PAS domain S-box protein [Brumimicrobium sp.]